MSKEDNNKNETEITSENSTEKTQNSEETKNENTETEKEESSESTPETNKDQEKVSDIEESQKSQSDSSDSKESEKESSEKETVKKDDSEEAKDEEKKEEAKEDEKASDDKKEEKASESEEKSTSDKKVDEKPAPKIKKDGGDVEIETQDKSRYDEVVEELEKLIDTDEVIEVEAVSPAKGGLRVVYKNVPLFLPASHFSLVKDVNQEKLKNSVGKKFNVKVSEVKKISEGKIVIVSRKDIILNEVWEKISVGDVIEGTVSSITDFGVFVDIGGVEGLIHISRLSHTHIDHPKDAFKVGQDIKAKIVDINKEKGKISLSKKAIEESPWKGIEEKFSTGDVVEGTINRLTNFGAYVEIDKGVEGLLRVSELSWAKRIGKPADILNTDEKIKVKILELSEEKEQAALSLKHATENPWPELVNKYKVGTETTGEVQRVFEKGAIARINDEVDAFIPISRINVLKTEEGDRPVKRGDELKIKVIDANAKEESLVVSPILTEEQENELKERRQSKGKPKGKGDGKGRGPKKASRPKTTGGAISFGDLLSSEELDNLKELD